ncbi:DUF2505 domain-containing protein [Nakamurella sp. GG22]
MARFHVETVLPADLGPVYAAMVDPATTQEKYQSLGNTEVSVESGEDGRGTLIHARRRVSVDLPGFMTKVMSPSNMYDQVDRWTPAAGGYDGRFEITVEGAPVHVNGTMTLREVPDGVTYVVDGEVKVSIPFVGGMAAGFAAEQAGKVAAEEGSFLKRLLG